MPRFKFSEIAENITEKRMPTPEDKELYIAPNNLDTDTLSVPEYGYKVDLNGTKLIMHKGDMLFGRREPQLKKAAIAPHDGLFSAHGMIFHPKEDVIAKEFFPFFISSDYFFDAAIRISVGSLSPTVNWKDLKNLEFYIPDISDQQKYAKILWAMIRAKKAYKQLIKKTEEIKTARFIEMFKGGQYPVVKAEEVCGFITKGTTPASNEIFTTPDEDSIPYLKVYNLSFDGEMLFNDQPQFIHRKVHEGKLSRSKVYPDDVLMNIVGPPLGKFALVNNDYPEWNINQAIAIFRAKDRVLPKFLLNALMQPEVLKPFIEKAQGVRQMNFSLEQCRSLAFPLPPIKEQEEFIAFAEQADMSKEQLDRTLTSLSLAQKAVLRTIFN